MTALVVIGAQWGDEGKGKVVDVLASDADVVARFAGGNNAGHTLVVDGRQLITHLVPSGCLYPGTRCLLSSGMVIDPDVLHAEVAELHKLGLLMKDELRVALDAHVIFPHHRQLDTAREEYRAQSGRHIGTTRRGIGPAYEAKAARRGIRVRDLFDAATLRRRLEQNVEIAEGEFARLGKPEDAPTVQHGLDMAARWAPWFEPMVCDGSALLFDALRDQRRVLLEGAQGVMLDVDHGTYPYVTSSNTTAGGACTGAGIGPTLIDGVWGITKAYTTRVGAGPLPTRLDGEAGERLREAGAEYGATTGRPRDCGWLDLPALRYAVRTGGMTGLVVTKLDVLAGLADVHVCTSYADGVDLGRDGLAHAVPVLERCVGWNEMDPMQIRKARRLEDLPQVARQYLTRISDYVEVPIVMVSVGPERDQTISIERAF